MANAVGRPLSAPAGLDHDARAPGSDPRDDGPQLSPRA
jgi:hypothetical protein